MKIKKINVGELNSSSINSQTVSSDIIKINNEYGHYEIGNNIGKTEELLLEKYILVFKGGILVDIQERKEGNNE